MSLSQPVFDIANSLRAISSRCENLCQDRFGERVVNEELEPLLQRVHILAEDLLNIECQLQSFLDDVQSLVESMP